MKKVSCLILLIFFLISCEKDKGTEFPVSKNYSLTGKIEKGPFVKGSKVSIQELDQNMVPTGKLFTSTINTDDGSFELKGVELASPFVELIADGYFYNETSGDLSKGQITLSGLADLTEQSTVNVNILTHLAKSRISFLMENENLSLKSAQDKSQGELLSMFGLQENNDKSFTEVSITDGTNMAASQILISSVLLKNRSEAQFTEFITNLSSSFKTTGSFSSEIKEELWATSVNLDIDYISRKLVERYASINKDIKVLDLSYFIDWDKDGIAGNELGDINEEKVLSFEIDTLRIGKEGGDFTINIQSNIPFTNSSNATSEEYFDGIYTPIKILSSKLQEKELILKIAPANGAFISGTTFTIHSYDGKLSASIVIQQEGDMDKISENKRLSEIFESIMDNAFLALDYNYTAEALYTHATNQPSNNEWAQFYNNQISPSSSILRSMWEKNYQLINRLNSLINFEELPKELEAQCITLRSIAFYQMVILWENIVYVENVDLSNIDLPQISKNESLQKIRTDLNECLDFLLSSKSKDSQLMPVSRFIAEGILAKVLINEKKYQQALDLLEKNINSALYALAASNSNIFEKGNVEDIYSVRIQGESNFKKAYSQAEIFPILRYTEILLLASECSFHLGLNGQALKYLNQVEKRSGVTPSSTITLEGIQERWRDELQGNFSYFDFLKRNGMAIEKLNLQSYRDLFPIPDVELMMNPNLRQNPGY